MYFSFCVVIVLSHPHAKSFCSTSVGKDWKSCKMGEIGHSKSFHATVVRKDWKNCELGEIGHLESF